VLRIQKDEGEVKRKGKQISEEEEEKEEQLQSLSWS
jgi:hypothetical protein